MTGDSTDRAGPRLSDGGLPVETAADGEGTTVSVDEAVERIREPATDVRDSELETALAKLESRGELPERDREAVAALADRLVDRLLAVPESSLREAADAEASAETGSAGDERTVETALELFG
jgi:glutamyl-tRNA reductase